MSSSAPSSPERSDSSEDNRTPENAAFTADIQNGIRVSDFRIEGRDAMVVLERIKLALPLLTIFLVKFLMENIVSFMGLFTCSFALYRTKSQLNQIIALKIPLLKAFTAISVLLVLLSFEVIILYSILEYCGIKEAVWQRMLFFLSTDPDVSLLSVVWKALLVDVYAQLVVLLTEALACLLYLSHILIKRRRLPEYVPLIHSTGDIEHGIESSTNESHRRAESRGRQVAEAMTTSSDMEDKLSSEIYLGEKRLTLLVALVGLIYRTLLPVR